MSKEDTAPPAYFTIQVFDYVGWVTFALMGISGLILWIHYNSFLLFLLSIVIGIVAAAGSFAVSLHLKFLNTIRWKMLSPAEQKEEMKAYAPRSPITDAAKGGSAASVDYKTMQMMREIERDAGE